MTAHPDLAALDRLKTRIQGLRSKTTDNGCTESEALLAAAKVAELLSSSSAANRHPSKPYGLAAPWSGSPSRRKRGRPRRLPPCLILRRMSSDTALRLISPWRGTESSNPSPSSGESGANLTSRNFRQVPSRFVEPDRMLDDDRRKTVAAV